MTTPSPSDDQLDTTEPTPTTTQTDQNRRLLEGTPAQRLQRIRDAHALRRRYNDEHLARMRRAAGAVLGTAKGLTAATGATIASSITINAREPWPIVIDGVPLPWVVDQDVRVDATTDDGQGRLWIGILTESLDIAQMPRATMRPTALENARKTIADLGRERDLLHSLLADEKDLHDETIGRLQRTRRRLARVHAAATRYRLQVDEARYAATRAESAVAAINGDLGQLALALVEANTTNALPPTPGSAIQQATAVIKGFNSAYAHLAATHDDTLERLSVLEDESARALLDDRLDAAHARIAELEESDAAVWMGRALSAEARLDAVRAPEDAPVITGQDGTKQDLAVRGAAQDQPPTVEAALAAARARAQADIDARAQADMDELARVRDQEGFTNPPTAAEVEANLELQRRLAGKTDIDDD